MGSDTTLLNAIDTLALPGAAASTAVQSEAQLCTFASALSLGRYDAELLLQLDAWMQQQLATGTALLTTADAAMDCKAVAASVSRFHQRQADVSAPAELLVQQLLPMLVTEPAWLAGSGASGLADTRLAALLWPVYHQRLRALHHVPVTVSTACSDRQVPARTHIFWRTTDYSAAALAPAVWHLALAEHASDGWPEIVGYTLGHMFWESTLAERGSTCPLGRMHWLHPYTDTQHARVFSALDLLLQTTPELRLRKRVLAAAALPALFYSQIAKTAMQNHDLQKPTPADAMLALLARKLPYARGHHRNKQLAGVPLEQWFGGSVSTQALLHALANSMWVDRQTPSNSRLLTELLAFGGPMFQVFSAEEIEVIKGWLSSLQHEMAPFPAEQLDTPVEAGRRKRVKDAQPAATHRTQVKLPIRTQFFRLLNKIHYPEIVDHADALVRQRLLQATRGLRWSGRFGARSFDYSEAMFRDRVQTIYAKAVHSYRPLTGPPRLNREEYRWLLRNLAPLFLVDGCWLQQAGSLVTTAPNVAWGLLDILGDEIGAGEQTQNHAYVFRHLLASEGCDLPFVNEAAFADDAGIVTVAYELPVYLLAIALHTRAYLPELLGLNLAIELSGLGGFYMRLMDELRYHGFDPTIIALHISIDNLASGHAAIARDLIPIYLADIEACQGPVAMQTHWRRVWSGYCSLDYMSRRLAYGLAWAYARRFAVGRIRQQVALAFYALWRAKPQQPL